MDAGQQLTIRIEPAPQEQAVLVVEGELDMHSALQLQAAVKSADAPGGLVVDLSEVAFLDSSAVGTLLQAAATTRAEGAGFAVVVGERTQSRSRLDLTGTSRVLNVCHDRDEALALLQRAPHAHLQPDVAGDKPAGGPLTLTLFLNNASPHAARARAAADALVARMPAGAAIEQVDVSDRPDLAERHRVLATPMLVRSGPPHRRVVGDLGNLDEVLLALDLPAARA